MREGYSLNKVTGYSLHVFTSCLESMDDKPCFCELGFIIWSTICRYPYIYIYIYQFVAISLSSFFGFCLETVINPVDNFLLVIVLKEVHFLRNMSDSLLLE